MRKLWRFCYGALTAWGVTGVAFAQSYDFDDLAPGPILGQDGWMPGGAVVEPATGSGVGQAMRGATWRNNDALFRFPAWTRTTTNAVMGFDFHLLPTSGLQYAKLQLAERDHGFAAAGSIGFSYDTTFNGFLVLRANGSGWAGGANFPHATGRWYRAEMRIDFTAYSGNGSASVFVKDLTAGQADFAPVAALQNIGLLLLTEEVDPALLDQLTVQTAGAQMDNLAFHPVAPWYGEAFESSRDPAAPAGTGWVLISDTDHPTAAVTNWAANDTQNVIKLTRANDAVSAFSNGYLYLEHDINNASETILSGNLYGQDAGDALLYTTEPLTQWAAESINVNRARFGVDYQCGDGLSSGAHFYFAVQTAAGGWYALQDANVPERANRVGHLTEDPIDPVVHEWKAILRAGGAPGQRLRLADTPVTLSAATLSNIVAVGLYLRPLTELQPSRFDNFTLLDFRVNPVPRLTIERTGTHGQISWPTPFNAFSLHSRTNLTAGAWLPANLPVASLSGTSSVTVSNLVSDCFYRLMKP